ncbi:MAG TPA: hypothetical protein VNW54_10185 [Granulicella sp.]|nr:hypothetical protein [Granulicella sp.]
MLKRLQVLCAIGFLTIPLFAQQGAASAADFVDSVGVNTHFSYTDTTYYRRPEAIISALQNLGVHHIRDGLAYSWVPPRLYSIYALLPPAAIHPDLVTPNPKAGGPTAETLEGLLVHYPGVDAIEAPNEYDQTKNPDWAADLRAYLPTLIQVSQHQKIALIGPSLTMPGSYPALGNIARFEDFSNLHVYWGGRNPEHYGWGGPNAEHHRYGSFAYNLDSISITSPAKPAMITETGYVVADTPRQNVIPPQVAAVYMPRLLLHAWSLGIRRTYIYELIDEPSSPRGFGLLNDDLSPRPAYTAVASLMRLLSDTSRLPAPGQLQWTWQGDSAGIETTLLEKHDGSFWLAAWLTATIYEVDGMSATPVPSRPITLNVGNGRRIRASWAFDDLGQTNYTVIDRATASVRVASAVTIFEIR